jgi:hypothetical protein
MSVFEVFCCINAVVWLSQKVFKRTTRYTVVKEELLADKLLDKLPKGEKAFYNLLFFFHNFFTLISLIILCQVISRFLVVG